MTKNVWCPQRQAPIRLSNEEARKVVEAGGRYLGLYEAKRLKDKITWDHDDVVRHDKAPPEG